MTRRFDDSMPFDLRRSGLPCRFAACPRIFGVQPQNDIHALHAAIIQRNTHEEQAHAYEHAERHLELAGGPNISPTMFGKGRMRRPKVRS